MISSQQSLDVARKLAALFSPAVYKSLGGEITPALDERLKTLVEFTSADNLGCAFDHAFSAVAAIYPNEYIFKSALIDHLVFGRHTLADTAPLQELRVRRSIVDLGVFNGTSTAYEIKTDMDTLRRLDTQLSDYRSAFEYVFVVMSEKLASRAIEQLPQWVGVIELASSGDLLEIREAGSNQDYLRHDAIFGLLRRYEVLRILNRVLDFKEDPLPAKAWARTKEVFSTLPLNVAHSETVRELSRRCQDKQHIVDAVPKSLRPVCLSVHLSKPSAKLVLERLGSSFADIQAACQPRC